MLSSAADSETDGVIAFVATELHGSGVYRLQRVIVDISMKVEE